MRLYSTAILSGVETGTKLISGLLVIKIIATATGADGIGLFSQLQNLMTIVGTIVSGCSTVGLVRYISSNNEIGDQKKINTYLTGYVTFGTVASCAVGFSFISHPEKISQIIFDSGAYSNSMVVIGFLPMLFVVFQGMVSYMNGMQHIKNMILLKIGGSFIMLISAFIVIQRGSVESIINSVVFAQLLMGVLALFFAKKYKILSVLKTCTKIVKSVQVDLLKYWVISIVGLISSSVMLLLIRREIVSTDGWAAAGLWDALNKMSDLSTIAITTALSVYLVPKLSASKEIEDQKQLMKTVGTISMATALIITVVIFLTRDFLITTIFTKEFLDISEVLRYQLAACVLRVANWIISFHIMIKSGVRLYLSYEILFCVTYYYFSVQMMREWGLTGLGLAFLINNALCLVVGIIYLKKFFSVRKLGW